MTNQKIEICGTHGSYGHEYSEIICPFCKSANNCWSCAVRCTNDSTGEGYFTCHECGHTTYYPIEE